MGLPPLPLPTKAANEVAYSVRGCGSTCFASNMLQHTPQACWLAHLPADRPDRLHPVTHEQWPSWLHPCSLPCLAGCGCRDGPGQRCDRAPGADCRHRHCLLPGLWCVPAIALLHTELVGMDVRAVSALGATAQNSLPHNACTQVITAMPLTLKPPLSLCSHGSSGRPGRQSAGGQQPGC